MIPIAWAPYLAVRLYWHHLLATVSGAEHGELSGPIAYLLPRLLWIGATVSAVALATAVLSHAQCSTGERKKMQNQPAPAQRP